jgi:hypothetical protein
MCVWEVSCEVRREGIEWIVGAELGCVDEVELRWYTWYLKGRMHETRLDATPFHYLLSLYDSESLSFESFVKLR